MRYLRAIRIYEISPRKKGNFINGIDFPFLIVYDISEFVRMFLCVRKGFFERNDSRIKKLLESLSSEYDFRWIDEEPGEFDGGFFYTATYNDETLEEFVRTLVLSKIKTRIVILVIPRNSRRICCFGIASQKEIENLLKSYFRDVAKIGKRNFEKILRLGIFNPRVLKKLTLRKLPGIALIPKLDPIIPVSFTFENKNSIRVGKLYHLTTRTEGMNAFLPVQRINQHVAILATTGAGKTNLCRHLVIELDQKGIPCLIFDWKRDYRDLSKKIRAKVYDFNRNPFTFNPLKPEGEPSMWAKQLASIMAEVISGGAYASGAFSIYIEIIDRLYRERGIYQGSRNYPNIFDMLEEIEEYSRKRLSERERNWIASALKLFKSLSVGKTRDAFKVREGISLARILGETTIIELEGLGDPLACAFFISVLLQKIRNFRLERKERDKLKHVIVIEEAQNVLTANHEASSIVLTTYREIRSLCEGIIAITQIPSKFSKDALANTNTFFIMKLVHQDDKEVARSILGMNENEIRILEHLEKGCALMKTDSICMIKVPFIEKEWVEIEEKKEKGFVSRREVSERIKDLSEREWKVLKALAESRAYNNSTLQKVTRFSNRELGKILGRLLEKGLIGYVYAKKEGVGRRQKIYFLFPYGEEAYRQKFGECPDRVRARLVRNKIPHSELKKKVMEALGIEKGKFGRFDIIAEDGPIEIETGTNNNRQIYENIKKSVERFGFARFVVTNRLTKNSLLQIAGLLKFSENKEFRLIITDWKELNRRMSRFVF